MRYDDDLDDDEIDDEYLDDHFDSGEDLDHPADDCLPCPQCGAAIHEDSQRCPVCGEYVAFDGGIKRHGVWWWTAFGLLAFIVVFWVLLR